MVFIVLLDGSFLSAAAVLTQPAWLAPTLTLAAVAYPLVFFVGLFVLQTRYREQLLDDRHLLKRLKEGALELEAAVTTTNLDFTRLSPTSPAPKLPASQQSDLESRELELERILQKVTLKDVEMQDNAIADASRELAHAALARGQWLEAAERLKRYLEIYPDDWSEWFAQAAAYANTRGGQSTDEAALNACNRALALMPEDADSLVRARLHSYRGGVLKRLGRLDDARVDLDFARGLAPAGSYEADDVSYNDAAIYAIEGRKPEAVEALAAIQDPSYLDAVIAHQDDYFSSLVGYGPYEQLVGSRLTVAGEGFVADR